jgi:hypothetical protein
MLKLFFQDRGAEEGPIKLYTVSFTRRVSQDFEHRAYLLFFFKSIFVHQF